MNGRVQQQRHPFVERGNDLYETPPVAVEALLRVETFPRMVWEPAAGRGAIVRALQAASYEVVSSDWITGVDFFQVEEAFADAIITNPPYKCVDAFVRHALALKVDKVSLLLRLVWLAGSRRRDLHERLSRVWVFSRRLPTMHREGWTGPRVSSMIDYAWFVWDRHAEPRSVEIGWL